MIRIHFQKALNESSLCVSVDKESSVHRTGARVLTPPTVSVSACLLEEQMDTLEMRTERDYTSRNASKNDLLSFL